MVSEFHAKLQIVFMLQNIKSFNLEDILRKIKISNIKISFYNRYKV